MGNKINIESIKDIVKIALFDFCTRYDSNIKEYESVYEYGVHEHGFSKDNAIAYAIAYYYRKQVPDYIFSHKGLSVLNDIKRIVDNTYDDINTSNKSIKTYVYKESKKTFEEIYRQYTNCQYTPEEKSIIEYNRRKYNEAY